MRLVWDDRYRAVDTEDKGLSYLGAGIRAPDAHQFDPSVGKDLPKMYPGQPRPKRVAFVRRIRCVIRHCRCRKDIGHMQWMVSRAPSLYGTETRAGPRPANKKFWRRRFRASMSQNEALLPDLNKCEAVYTRFVGP